MSECSPRICRVVHVSATDCLPPAAGVWAGCCVCTSGEASRHPKRGHWLSPSPPSPPPPPPNTCQSLPFSWWCCSRHVVPVFCVMLPRVWGFLVLVLFFLFLFFFFSPVSDRWLFPPSPRDFFSQRVLFCFVMLCPSVSGVLKDNKRHRRFYFCSIGAPPSSFVSGGIDAECFVVENIVTIQSFFFITASVVRVFVATRCDGLSVLPLLLECCWFKRYCVFTHTHSQTSTLENTGTRARSSTQRRAHTHIWW